MPKKPKHNSPRQIRKKQASQASKERTHFLKETCSASLKAITLTSLAFAYAIEGDTAVISSNLLHSLSFILEHGMDYYSDKEARKAYNDSKEQFGLYDRSELGKNKT